MFDITESKKIEEKLRYLSERDSLTNVYNRRTMYMKLEEMIEVVLLRIPREAEAMKYYISAAKRISSKTSKELFFCLAEEEAGHEN